MEIVEAVKHYQKSIERCPGDEQRMLHCISKLYRLPVTVQHLQDTGVGRTVNALRKYEGGTGEAAKALVAKWKAMVAAEDSSEGEAPVETPVEPPPPEPIRESPIKPTKEHQKSGRHNHHEQENHKSDRNKKSKEQEEQSSRRHKDDIKLSHNKVSKDHKHSHKRKLKESSKDRKREEKRRRKEESESSSEDANDESESEEMQAEVRNSESESEEESREINSREESQESQESDASSAEPVTFRRNSNHHDTHRKHEKHKEKSRSDDRGHSRRSESSMKSEGTSNSSSKGDRSRSKDNKDESNKHRKDEKRKVVEVKKESKEHRPEKSKSKSESSHSASIPKNDAKQTSVKIKAEPSSSKSPVRKSKDSAEKKGKKTEKSETTGDGSIDCFSGASFAEALGMVDPVVKKKQQALLTSPGTSSNVATPRNSTSKRNSSHEGSSSAESRKSSKESNTTNKSYKVFPGSPNELGLLSPAMKLEPLDMDVNFDSTLPTITPNYRPLPHVDYDTPARRSKLLSEEEALCQVMSTKNQRTKVYSGVKSGKSWASVPSLYDICIRVLQENIDAMEYTGGVPYDLLKPVLAHASPEQLLNLEYYNPYLIEDTDQLWEYHCTKQFRNKQRQEMETSREMYLRCLEEREAKLKTLTTNISQSIIAKSAPVRKTKLAYVDSVVKPPRNVVRQQAKYGTAHSTNSTPMAKSVKTGVSGAAGAVAVSAPSPRPVHTVMKMKPRMAPLMQKTMKLAKSFKR